MGDGKAFQMKELIEHRITGRFCEDMESRLESKHPGVAAAALNVQKPYSGVEKLL